MESLRGKLNIKRNDECLTYKFKLTTKLMGEAILITNQILNIVSYRKPQYTPYEKLMKGKSTWNTLKYGGV